MLCLRDPGDSFLNDKPASYNFKIQNQGASLVVMQLP